MQEAIAAHKPVRIFALFSGGKDSMASTHFAMNHGAMEVVHINTGIGIEETRVFVRDTCNAFGWPLRELHPPDMTYRDFVLKHGFPVPGGHRYSYVWLKERALHELCMSVKTRGRRSRERIMLVTGVRNLESARRMGFVEPIKRIATKVWVAPLFQFSDIDLAHYRKLHNLPLSEVSSKFGMSGECLCGAFAAPDEMQRLERLYPDVAAQIHALEIEAEAAGVHCKWGKRPPKDKFSDKLPFMAMCVGCPAKASMQVRGVGL